jgi:hypothetical protein
MKRILSAALGLAMLAGSAATAAADPWDHEGYDRDRYYHHHNDGAAVVAGIGFLTLAAVIAAQHRDHDGWYARHCSYYRDWDGYYHRVCERDRYDDGYRYGY